MSAWNDLGHRGKESYEEILARSLVKHSGSGMTEAERAAKLVADRERMRVHDAYFASQFLSPTEETIISTTLARQLGYPEQYEGEEE